MSTALQGGARQAFACAPHRTDPDGQIGSWYTEPPGVVVQLLRPAEGTLEMCNWLAGPGTDALLRRFPSEPLILVFDMRLMTGREPRARNALIEPAKKLKPRIQHGVLLPPERASRVYLSSLYAATALLSVFGYHLELASSLETVIAKYRLVPAR